MVHGSWFTVMETHIENGADWVKWIKYNRLKPEMLFSVHGDMVHSFGNSEVIVLKEYLFLFCAQRVSVSGVLDHGSDGSMDRCSLRFYICLHVFSRTFGGSFCSANVVLPAAID